MPDQITSVQALQFIFSFATGYPLIHSNDYDESLKQF